MAKLPPKQHPLSELLENGLVEQEYRPYIGMSGILGKCPRYLWYQFYWAYERKINRRTDRIFKRGDIEESRVVADLRSIGCHVTECEEDQTEIVDGTGHIKGHKDGRVTSIPGATLAPHLLEVKTMKQAQYTKFLKEGLARSHPYYWGQIHTYMGEEGFGHCLFVVCNKDTEHRRYVFYTYDENVHKDCISIAHGVLMSEYPPEKIAPKPTWFECKICDAVGICHNGEAIKRTCRSCKHANIENEGQWSCELYVQWLSEEDQMKACDDYKLSEVFS